MAEMIGSSRAHQRRNGAVAGFFAALKQGLSRLTPRRATRLHAEDWSDYLLRDVGLDRAALNSADPRPTDWLGR